MTKNAMQFYHRYNEDGSCKVICMDCYATLGTGWDRHAVARMEAGHICGEWKRAAEDVAGNDDGRPDANPPHGRPFPSSPEPILSAPERVLTRLHPAILVALMALLLYAVPTALEILARSHVNTWLAVILPGDAAGCAVLIAIARMPKTGILLYTLLTACECCEHMMHGMRGITMAWFTDLIPTLVVIGVLLVRAQRLRAMERSAFS